MSDIGRHLTLMHKMSAAQGVDMLEARARRLIPEQDFAALITQCRACAAPEACATALAAGHRLTECPNAPYLDQIAALTRK